MFIDKMILYFVIVVSIGLMISIPKEKRRIAQMAFLFKQLLTWILGLVVVENGLIEYPVRFFASVNRTSFTFEFLAFPAVCGFFMAHFPSKRSWIYKLGYYTLYCTILTLIEVLLEKYTILIKYIHWSWYCTWIMLFVTLFISRTFCFWYFRQGTQNHTSTVE